MIICSFSTTTPSSTPAVWRTCWPGPEGDKKAGGGRPDDEILQPCGASSTASATRSRNHDWGCDNFIGCVDIGQFDDVESGPISLLRGGIPAPEGRWRTSACWTWATALTTKTWTGVSVAWFRGWRIVPAPLADRLSQIRRVLEVKSEETQVRRPQQTPICPETLPGRIMLGFAKRYARKMSATLSLVKKGSIGMAWAYPCAYLSLAWSLPEDPPREDPGHEVEASGYPRAPRHR